MRIFHRLGHRVVFRQMRQISGNSFATGVNQCAGSSDSRQLDEFATCDIAQRSLLTFYSVPVSRRLKKTVYETPRILAEFPERQHNGMSLCQHSSLRTILINCCRPHQPVVPGKPGSARIALGVAPSRDPAGSMHGRFARTRHRAHSRLHSVTGFESPRSATSIASRISGRVSSFSRSRAHHTETAMPRSVVSGRAQTRRIPGRVPSRRKAARSAGRKPARRTT